MNWDKQNVLAVIIGAAALIFWYMYAPKMPGETSSPAAPAAVQTQPSAAQSSAAVPATPAGKAAVTVADMPSVSITANGSTYSIRPVSGTVEKVTFDEKFLKNDRTGALELVNEYPQLAKLSSACGTMGLRSSNGVLTTVKVLQSRKINDHEYLLVRQMRDTSGNEFTVMTTFKAVENYQLKVSMQFVNTSNQALNVPSLLISGGDLQQWHRMSGDQKSASQELHTVEYCTVNGKTKYEEANADSDDWSELNGKQVRWFGVANRFFILLMKSPEAVKMQFERVENPSGSKEFTVSCAAVCDGFALAPKASKELVFDYYLGPKYPETLRSFDSEASETMHLGWFPIDFLAYIMLAVLNWLHGFVGSFGWSIILLTLLIRTIFFPVTMKANASMREMQVLSPKLKEIREKYKDEPMVAQTKMSELYREHHVNPLGGCLPMLIQIPVFIALYYALGSAAELRMQSFLWIKDLAQPDTVAHVLGIAINPLIIAWTLLMVVQQKLTPTAMDPMQAKVMLAMPLVMLFILYSLPSALTLYWTVSQIFSIAQMLYQNKLKKHEDARRQEKEQEKTEKPKIVRS